MLFKKKVISTAVLTLITVGGASGTVHAAISADRQSGETDTIVGFASDNIVLPPQNGELGISRIPSAFDFGRENQVSSTIQTISATNAGTQYVTATDLRTSKNTWSVTAQASDLVNILDSTDKISAATIQISGHATTNDGASWGSTNDVAVNTVNLNAGGDSATFISTTAADTSSLPGQEVGAQIRAVNLNLAANQGASEQQYTGFITWNLESVPTP
ncbi:hypothetical protein D920_00079 [Enterococcus faecalis 13-SD-W-01]|nr:hypothetical protein D920_00079 [Enterococcus faecalis 13-SD-W-01]